MYIENLFILHQTILELIEKSRSVYLKHWNGNV